MAKNKLVHDYNKNLQAFGQAGFDALGASETVTAHTYIAITALEDSSITIVAETGDSLTTSPIPKGLTIYGRFSSVTCVSGKILAYREALDV